MTSLTSQTLSLEEVFLQLTESEPDAAAPTAPAEETAPAAAQPPRKHRTPLWRRRTPPRRLPRPTTPRRPLPTERRATEYESHL